MVENSIDGGVAREVVVLERPEATVDVASVALVEELASDIGGRVVARDESVEGSTEVVTEVDIKMAVLPLEVCIDVGLGGVVTADSDSTEDVTNRIVGLDISCDVSKEVGFGSEITVEMGGADVGTVDATISVGICGTVGWAAVELFI